MQQLVGCKLRKWKTKLSHQVWLQKKKKVKYLHSHTGSTSNFSLKYVYNVPQTGNENTQIYRVEVFVLIWHQILLL